MGLERRAARLRAIFSERVAGAARAVPASSATVVNLILAVEWMDLQGTAKRLLDGGVDEQLQTGNREVLALDIYANPRV